MVAPDQVGKAELMLFLMSDSYMGCDQEHEIILDIKEGTGSDDDEEEDSE
ncbi:unnamed protein product [Chrysoparadoxa australica]